MQSEVRMQRVQTAEQLRAFASPADAYDKGGESRVRRLGPIEIGMGIGRGVGN